MVTECVAILAISLCLVVVFIRAGHGDYAASVTPILVVPFVHLLALPVSWWTDSLFPRACASIGGGVCGYRRRSGFLPYDHVLFGEDQEQEE